MPSGGLGSVLRPAIPKEAWRRLKCTSGKGAAQGRCGMDRERHIRLADERWRHRLGRKGKRRKLPAFSEELETLAANHDRLMREERGLGYDGDRWRSPILGLYAPFKAFKRRKGMGPKHIIVPSNFSLTHNADEVLAFFREVAVYARTAKTPRLFLDHSRVKQIGLAADSVLGVLLKEISLENRWRRGAYVRGVKPRDPAIRKMMDEIGCVRVLMSDVGNDINVSIRSDAKVFRHQSRKHEKTDALTLDHRGATAKKFADHLNECLSGVKKELTPAGRARLLRYVGEILDNAQEHSGLSEWTIVGYIDPRDENLTYRCAVLSFGSTVADTFRDLSPDSVAMSEVASYLEIHGQQRWFSTSWREEDLIAVMSLQADISSKQLVDGDRGQGTVEFIEFFQTVCAECAGLDSSPGMTMLTGGTLIKFDGRYKMRAVGSQDRKVIAFNDANSLFQKPDPKAVRALEGNRFPGVIISISIPLLQAVVDKSNGQEDEN